MSEFENNHYVPQLILRRYGEKINRYNLITKEWIPLRNIKNCFSKKNMYPLEIEKLFQKVEGPFGNLLNNNILSSEKEVILKRHEIDLIKKFLIILQMRAPVVFKEDRKSKRISKEQANLMGLKEVKIPDETDDEYIYRTIRVIIESNTLQEVFEHPKVTYEACKWALLYNNCYLTIWDSKKSGEDFVITDVGMTCEHEYTKFMPYSDFTELLKNGYLIYNIIYGNQLMKDNYSMLLAKSQYVYANYYMFSISETRMIGLINPFFRLYYDNIFFSKPDIWPTKLSKEALEANSVDYKKNPFEKQDNDEYIYKIKNLSLDDVLIINSMMLDRVQEVVGFVESGKIVRSLVFYNSGKNLNDYSDLIEKIKANGYDIPNQNKYMSKYIESLKKGISPNDNKYIDMMLKKMKEISNNTKV